ncbi:hypothetical protein GQ53DRAFT_756349 [Thozetella sp. PMI_491]|nr:hypothetical protein GQ53DRAFT_756349 [Thozetella sp. PMI_491]
MAWNRTFMVYCGAALALLLLLTWYSRDWSPTYGTHTVNTDYNNPATVQTSSSSANYGSPSAETQLQKVPQNAAEATTAAETAQAIVSSTSAARLTSSSAAPAAAQPTASSPPQLETPQGSPSGLAVQLAALFQPLKLAVDAPVWTDSDGAEFKITQTPTWTKPLGKRLCLIDIDTRPLNGTNEILDNGHFNWTEHATTSAGMLGHYLYAQIHGYDYKFVRTRNFPDRASYWTKIPALSDTLRDYEFVISIDADAQINHPEIPFEWLLNRWNVTKDTALTMTIDPDKEFNWDPFGRPMNNAGLVMAHNIPRTHEILKAWASCPDEPREEFNRCSRWKNPWPAEQAAFGEYIRYMYNEPNDLREVPCDEANGYPESESNCSGRFIHHLWLDKGKTKDVINTGFMQIVMKRLHDQFLADTSVVIERESNAFERDGAQ